MSFLSCLPIIIEIGDRMKTRTLSKDFRLWIPHHSRRDWVALVVHHLLVGKKLILLCLIHYQWLLSSLIVSVSCT